MLIAALALGLLVGLLLGALGGGGSILTVPVLVFLLGLGAQQATTASLVIVGVTAAAASVGHARRGGTRWRTGLLLGAVGVPASVLGAHLNRLVDPNLLLLSFAGLMLVAAAGMLLRSDPQAPESDEPPPPGGGTATATATRAARQELSGLRTALRLLATGLVVGFLTGFLGVGGGFVIVPALVLALRMPMPVAVGTSLLVIAVNSAVALAARAGSGSSFEAKVVVPFTLAAVLGSLLGGRVGDRVGAATLTRAFGGLLVAVAVYVATRAVLALT